MITFLFLDLIRKYNFEVARLSQIQQWDSILVFFSRFLFRQ